jgi:hypothetical protein
MFTSFHKVTKAKGLASNLSCAESLPLHKNKTLDLRITAVAMLAMLATQVFAFDSGSTGADGVFAPTVNTEVQLPPSGILNYASINIPLGVTVKFKKNATNTPVYLLVSGNATIAGSINISGTRSADVGTAGNGNLADDGNPGLGGPGGFDGGRGGRDDVTLRNSEIAGGAGLGPGGGYGAVGAISASYNNTVYCNIATYGFSNGVWILNGGYASHSNAGSAMSAGYVCPIAPATVFSATIPAKPAVPAYGSAILQPLVGGSGGGGGAGGYNFGGSGGSGGGGAILLAATGTINLTGSIYATEGGVGAATGVGVGGIGGFGTGGSVRLVATTMSGAGVIATYSNTATVIGRVRIEAENITYTGTTYPTYVADTPAPVFLANVPSLKIVNVGGSAVPAEPTGVADITFPANLVNPVTISLVTTNVPVGNTVLVKIIPATGPVIEAVSPAISGTTANGTASVSVSLPQGPSTIQAMTTYTVVIAMGEALSQYAKNERVEKVQIVASLGGAGYAKLITISGKEFDVPMSVLQSVGFTG